MVAVVVGQVWASQDSRDFGRVVRVTEVGRTHIVGRSTFNGSTKTVRIRIDRLTSNRSGGAGYKLVAEPAPATPSAPPAGEAAVG